MRFPEELVPLLAKLPDLLANLLGTDLVGLYLYGSILEPTFDPARSDVDCVAVTEWELTDVECRQLSDRLTEAATIEWSSIG